MLKIASFFVALTLAGHALAAGDLVFKNIDTQTIQIGKDGFEVGIYGANDGSPSNLVFAVHKNSFLIKLSVLDGASPSVVLPVVGVWPLGVFGIRLNQGGHERLIKFFSLKNGGVSELGEIGSNAACILSRPNMRGLFESVDEEKGAIFLTTYKIDENKVRKIKSQRFDNSWAENIKDWCANYNVK